MTGHLDVLLQLHRTHSWTPRRLDRLDTALHLASCLGKAAAGIQPATAPDAAAANLRMHRWTAAVLMQVHRPDSWTPQRLNRLENLHLVDCH